MTRNILFIYPHPDDESFLSGGTIAKYARMSDTRVFLYTMTRGESSRNAAYLGITSEEIARRRVLEVRKAAAILGVSEHFQGNWPDGGLRDLDPRILEADIEECVLRVKPTILVTFDVQGGSVHPDHIVVHHVVKRVHVSLMERGIGLKRLCFSGQESERIARWPRRVFGIPKKRLDAVIEVGEFRDIERRAIEAHESVRRDFEEYNFDDWMFWNTDPYSFFRERYDPPVDDLFHDLQ